ncbi:MAG: TAXI family TRAP transporter solute-binding subunit [Leucobacter sp.]
MTMVDPMSKAAGRLRFQGDWGGANLHRAAGWLSQWVWDNTPEHRFSVIYTGRGMGDNLVAVSRGEVDVAFATPADFARLALEGRGPFEGRALPNLRAIAVLSHRDAMIPVVRAELGITSLAEIAASESPLRVSLGVNDPDGFMGAAADMVLEAAGVDLEAIVRRGGAVARHEQPFDAVADLREGRADLMVSEAIMTPDWQALAREQEVRFLGLAPAEALALQERWGLGTIEIPANYFPGADYPVTALNYSDWICVAADTLEDETAALLARAFVEDGEYLARGYRHLPLDYSPLRYPIDFQQASRTPIPLHPAAAAVYAAAMENIATDHRETGDRG